jgi:hypothetical protein
MTSRDFCYWLQGLFEIADPATLNAEAVSKIKAHLNMVFLHEIDPSMGDKQHQDELQIIHDVPLPSRRPTGEPVYKC